jgi:hypothetical protein
MSAERHLNPSDSQPTATGLPIETVYTTIESQPDQTDWLTVVSNLRQINRQLVEQIARLEQALASSKQSLHTYKEEKQTHEITILQQQDELRMVHERVGALFQQLETSHQIGQRQQTLIETISQQLEITQAIVPQLEAENNELQQKYQSQQQKLAKTEQVALELHRRMKHSSTAPKIEAAAPETETAAIVESQTVAVIDDPAKIEPATNTDGLLPATESHAEIAAPPSQPALAAPETEIVTATLETTSIAPKPPQSDIPVWNPTPPTHPARSVNWHEANNLPSDRFPSPTLTPTPPAEVVNKESTASEDPKTAKPSPNWPAPTLERRMVTDGNPDLSVKKKVIDLPKFPRNK